MIKNRLKARKQIISLLRGFYFLPIFLNLHKEGIIDEFPNNRFKNINKLKFKNTNFLKRVLDYLVRLDLFERKKNTCYRMTKFGVFISKRLGTMYILNSYSKIINNFSTNLNTFINENSWCERKDNIIGSGLIHTRKFFEPSLKLINLEKTNYFLDIGCGDGSFLNVVKKSNNNIKILGCDLSNESVKQTKKKLGIKKKNNIFQSNGTDILKIKKKLELNKIKLDKNSVISLWFLLHEISNNSEKMVVSYLKKIRTNFPETPILIGEISKFDDKIVSEQKSASIMPEFMLFHELSRQGLLSENQYLSIFEKSSYKLKKIIRTDNLKVKNKRLSTNFICLIEPKIL
jgi:2-polyprenyl-3-methyl-5-hydroxy-6-metoxy-1,4-benzoquinol methylase